MRKGMDKDQQAKRILLVDDEPLARLVARKCLEGAGFAVVEAASGAQAEDLWSRDRHDLVVLDHRLEDGLGLDVLRRMRARGKQEPVIYLSAETEELTGEIQRELAVAALVAKPLNLDALAAAARSLLGGADVPASGPMGDYRGKFRLWALAGTPDEAAVNRLRAQAGNEAWVALDARQAGEIGPACAAKLADWAREIRLRGGCLCVVGLPAETERTLRHEHVDRDVDLAPDLRALDALGRRMASPSERMAVLNSVVRRDL